MAALGTVSSTWALGFGEARSQVVLGQPLNLAIPVALGEGESLSAECAAAEVTPGDTRLQPSQVRVRVTQGAGEAIIRVTTTVPIEEPILLVAVSAGCPARITRTLTLLADPPLVSAVVAPTPSAPTPPSAAAPAPASEAPRAVSGMASPPAGEPPRRATRPAPPQRAARAALRPAPAAAATPAPVASRPPTAPSPAPARSERAARPRLQLDSARISTPEQVAAAEAQASAVRAATQAAEAAASSAQQRMQAMETELARVRADAKAQTDALLQLRQQIAQDQADRDRQNLLTPFLMAAAGILALVAGWLGWRLRQQQSAVRREAWWDRGQSSQMPSVAAEEDSRLRAPVAPRLPRNEAPPPPAPAPQEDSERGAFDSIIAPPTVAAPVAVTIPPLKQVQADETKSAMSVDEQIDLEQQADFFIALGHDDAAIDLLMAHLRNTGGGTPLPFLKLLEIHRRRGDREAYERTRVRFNQRFNSLAPDWNADPKSGRALEDYPLTIGRLQRAWPTPLDAMAELEALLFRRGAGAELFDLPAYQEVLFLYQMARDLHAASQPADAVDSSVDVLLPIGAAAPPVPEGTIVLKAEFNHGEPLSLDLDLSTTTEPAAPAVPDLNLDFGNGEPPKTEPPKTEPEEDIWGVTGNKRRDI